MTQNPEKKSGAPPLARVRTDNVNSGNKRMGLTGQCMYLYALELVTLGMGLAAVGTTVLLPAIGRDLPPQREPQ